MKIPILLVLISSIVVAYSFQRRTSPTAVIKFIPVFNEKTLSLKDEIYFTANGDPVQIDQFRFYISGIQLNAGEDDSYKSGEIHLIDCGDTSSLSIKLDGFPAEKFTQISFSVGVDSLSNVSGILEGPLDPANTMYWAWNTGYINAKLSGRSEKSTALHNTFEFHIGGYMPPYKTLKKINLPLNNFRFIDSKELQIYVDVAEWFENPVLIDLSKINNIVIPGEKALMMAGNYSDMFYIR